MNKKIIRAVYDNETITVYQAFNKYLAQAAVENQTFVSPLFKKERMTWIKPSFLWMMYRSGWAMKEEGKQILRIKIKRSGFEWALRNSCLSHFEPSNHSTPEAWKKKLIASPVRIQWDPERNIFLEPLTYRAIQIGLSGIAVEKYIYDWIISIENITEYVGEIRSLIESSNIDQALLMLPKEKYYPISQNLENIIGIYK